MLAAHHNLTNLTVLIDRNTWQAMGRTEEIIKMEPLGEKWRVWGFKDIRVDGHNYEALEKAIGEKADAPKVIICDTIKGKGVSFMEDSLVFHYKYVDDEVYEKAMKELQ
jgi:transketolase